MFDKTRVRGSLAVGLAVTMLAGTAMADVTLPTGLTPGTKYQIAFVTADTITGTSGTENAYNDFVTAQAALSSTLASLGASWTAITTTADGTNASANAPAHAGVTIYNTLGQPVAAGGALYAVYDSYFGYVGGTLANPIDANQYGAPVADAGVWVWTGSEPDGAAAFSGFYQMGASNNEALFGLSQPGLTSQSWITTGEDNINYYGTFPTHPVYALSSEITVPSPEPATLALLLGGLGLARLMGRRGA